MDAIGIQKNEHEFWMRRCLELAVKGRGMVSPNPMVGAVLVRDGVLLGEGWHAVYGGSHAERMLFDGLEEGKQNKNFSDCILYVSLEPCAHFGKTPPCANLILEKGVGKVVVGVLDPNPLVSGKGVALLRAAGVEVLVGVLEEECRQLNWAFWVNQVLGRAAVIAKWAETGDGYMGSGSEERVMISGPEANAWVHGLRAGVDAILVGVNTWNLDRPNLNIRGLEVSKKPIRIVLDRRLRGEYSAESVGRSEAPLWVIYDLNLLDREEMMGVRESEFLSLSESLGTEKLVSWGLELWEGESSDDDIAVNRTVERILQWLYEAHGLGVILVEGGASILQLFLDADRVDVVHILRNPERVLGGGVKSPRMENRVLRRLNDLGTDAHWVWHRNFGAVGLETGKGDWAE
jgi:diaminohydroxyphosphoribosylaminopyrimidine deaminase/5-amino-6-(5-phosphoribosylamino)uracil reductase